jgi:uncharacterized protein YegP (UPF0339 family)
MSKRAPKVTVYVDDAGEFRWRLVARNGKILTGGEGHTRRRDAWRAFRTAQADMAAAVLVVEP